MRKKVSTKGGKKLAIAFFTVAGGLLIFFGSLVVKCLELLRNRQMLGATRTATEAY